MRKRATKPVNTDMLTCPRCGSQRFERVIAGFVKIHPFTMKTPYAPVFSDNMRFEPEDGWAAFDEKDKHFRCAKCDHVLRDKYRHKITSETGLLTYLNQQ